MAPNKIAEEPKAVQDVTSKSRYATRQASDFEGSEVTKEMVPGIVAELRDSFLTEETYSYEWRKQHLLALRKFVVECEKDLCEALWKDLHKNTFEGYLTEVNMVITEIDNALHHLKEWMQPTKTGNSILNIPSWSTIQRDPLGVVLVLGAWNYPVNLSLVPIVGAIAGGNCVLLKPGSYALATSNVLTKLIPKYMDSRFFRVVEGNRDVTSAILAQKYDLIFFTGSPFVGKIVMRAAAEHLTPVCLELGGKSPVIVDKSVSIEHAARRIVWAKGTNSGQTCISPDFMCVHESVADALLEAMLRARLEFYGNGDAFKKTEYFGRLINAGAYDRLSKLIEGERDRLVCGGVVDAKERFMELSIVDFKTDFEAFRNSDLMSDELFGPILPVYRYKDLNQVIEFVKRLPTGKPLAVYAYGTDQRFVQEIKTRTTSGNLLINDCMMHVLNDELGFGGVGNSGMGNYHGKHSFDAFTHEKGTLEKSPALDESFLFKPVLDCRFPPYASHKRMILRALGKHWIDRLVNIPIPMLRLALKLAFAFACFRLAGFRITRA